MKQYHTRHRFSSSIALALVAGFYVLITFPGIWSWGSKHRDACSGKPVQAKTIYKTIYSTDDSNSLIGFELHSTVYPLQNGEHKVCSVVVRSMDPQKEDYKTYCKDIVKELLSMYGNSNTTVNIYDSFEAYSLATDDDRLLSLKEEQYINQHKIAVLDAYAEDRENYACLTYFPAAGNKLYFREYLEL